MIRADNTIIVYKSRRGEIQKNSTFRLGDRALSVLCAAVFTILLTACPNAAGGGGTSGGNTGGGSTPTPPPVTKYKVTLENTIGGNVSVSPALPADGMVAENTELTFTAAALSGYALEKWELNGEAVNGTVLAYTLKVTKKASVKVFFKTDGTPITTHTVTLTPGVNGTVSSVPEIPFDNKVPVGTEIVFTAVPDDTFAVDKWTVTPAAALIEGGTDGSTTAKVKVTAGTTVTVTFKATVHQITFGVTGPNGTISAQLDGSGFTSGNTVEEGKTVVFTATPDAQFAVEKWTVDGNPVPGNTTNTYNHTVSSQADIKVKFKYAGAALQVNQQNFTGTVNDTLPVYKLVTSGSGDYTATPENPSVISVNLNNSTGNVTVRCLQAGSSRIKVRDNKSGEEKYSGIVTVPPLVTIPNEFTVDNIKYRVIDKPQRHVQIDHKTDGNFTGTVNIAATVEFNGETYKITGCTDNCLSQALWDVGAFTVEEASEFLSAENGVLFNKNKTRLIKYPNKKTDTSYTVPDSVQTIGNYAFYEIYDNLTSLSLPEGKSLTTIEDDGIKNCTQLANINIPSTLTSLGEAFLFNTKITNAVIPEGIERLKHGSLAWCPNLARVELPASFEYFSYNGSIYNCPALTEVVCKAVTPPDFSGVDSFGLGTPIASATLKVPAGSVEAYKAADIWKNFGTIEALP